MFPFLAQAQPGQMNRVIDSIARTPLSYIIILVAALTVVRIAIAPYLKSMPAHRRTGAFGLVRFLNETLDAVIYAGVFVFLLVRPFGIQMFQIPSGSMEDTLQVNDYIVANKAIYRYSDPKVGDIIVFRPPRGAVQELSYIDEDGQVNQDFIKRCVGAPGDVVEIKDGKLWRNGNQIDEPFLKNDPDHGAEYTPFYYKLVHYTGPNEPFHDRYVPVNASAPFGTPNVRVNAQEVGGPPIGQEFAVGISRVETPTPKGKPGGVIQVWTKDLFELSPDERRLNDDLAALPPAAIPKGFYLMIGDNRSGSFDGRFWGLVPRASIIGRSEAIMWPPKRWRRTR